MAIVVCLSYKRTLYDLPGPRYNIKLNYGLRVVENQFLAHKFFPDHFRVYVYSQV